MKNKIFAGIFAILLMCTMALPADAAATRVELHGQRIMDSGQSRVLDGVFYVPMQEVTEALGASAKWDPEEKTMTVTTKDFTATAHVGNWWIQANEACIYAPGGVLENRDGVLVPLEAICTLFDCTMKLENAQHAVIVPEKIPKQVWNTQYNEKDLYWLSRIVYAESGAESFECQLAVAEVVLNRVAHDWYPDTVKEVIFDEVGGIQFEPVLNGSVYNSSSESCIAAAKVALGGSQTMPDETIFFVSALIHPNWISMNRPYIATIGITEFYG